MFPNHGVQLTVNIVYTDIRIKCKDAAGTYMYGKEEV